MVSGTRIVYVLVSQPEDYYAEMAAVSMAALRMVSPSLQVTLVCDPSTHSSLKGIRALAADTADSVVVCDTGYEGAMSSRVIKTTLRQRVEGDYLFLDVDAVPVRPLDELVELPAEIAAALDGNVPAEKFVFHDFERAVFDSMGWPFPIRPYFNSGVMLVRDTPRTREFYQKWHELWSHSRQTGNHKDQPALNYTNQLFGSPIQELIPQWNALVAMHQGGVRRARIIHYSGIRFEQRDDTVFHGIVKDVRRRGVVNHEALRDVMRTGYPWTDRASFRKRIAVGDYLGLGSVAFERACRLIRNSRGRPAPRVPGAEERSDDSSASK